MKALTPFACSLRIDLFVRFSDSFSAFLYFVCNKCRCFYRRFAICGCTFEQMSVKKSRCFEFSQPLTDLLPMKLLFCNRLLSPQEKTPFFIRYFAVFVLNFCNRSEKFVTWENFVFYNMPSLKQVCCVTSGVHFQR